VLPVLLLALARPGGDARAADDALKAVRESVLKALDDKDPKRRAQAYLPLQGARDPRALEIVVEAARKVQGLREKLRAEQIKAEQAYEKAINDLDDLDLKFREKNDQSPRATDAYNKRERKIAEARDAALALLSNLENEGVRVQALLDGATTTAGTVLSNVDPEALEGAMDYLDRTWLRAPDAAEALRFLDAVGGLKPENARRRVRLAAADGALAPRVRAAAVANLSSVNDDSLPQAVLPYLTLGAESFPLVRASIAAATKAHRREAIEPLIAFLGREDIGVLRTDAHEALQSLTGEKHGPYRQPWADWWRQAQGTFRMPDKPVEKDRTQPAGKGVTFYGITTFSDRILFVLDVSGSMDKPDAKDKPQPDRLTVAKQELLGAVFNVDDGHRFNVLLFNHEVIPWQPAMVVANEDQRRKAKEWIQARHPTGGTNIHDALEAAFGIALRATGEPSVDTVFFLTDGTPTAGKIRDPKSILEAVKEWNRSAHLTLHCIAVGEADHEFLKVLAVLGNGQFLQR
jgi:hypothetical protein